MNRTLGGGAVLQAADTAARLHRVGRCCQAIRLAVRGGIGHSGTNSKNGAPSVWCLNLPSHACEGRCTRCTTVHDLDIRGAESFGPNHRPGRRTP